MSAARTAKVLAFPSRGALDLEARLEKARVLIKKDGEFAKHFRYWFDQWKRPDITNKEAWLLEFPCPTTRAEGEDFDRRMTEKCVGNLNEARRLYAEVARIRDREFEGLMRPRSRRRGGK